MGGTLSVGMIIGLVVILLLHGAADPPTAGSRLWSDAQMTWAADQGWSSAPEPLPNKRFTLRVEARMESGSDPSASWGVWLETTDGGRVLYAISGEKYITTRRCAVNNLPVATIEDCPAVRPEWRWFEYNRLKGPGHSNIITLHRETAEDIRLRLNDERMGISPIELTGRWGVWARGGREGSARLVWNQAEIDGQP